MSLALLVGLAADVEPSPSPTSTTPPLEDWEVTPGLTGFLATFAVAAAAVVLFLSLSRHMRKANAYARAHGIEVAERRTIGFRRDEPAPVSAGSPDTPVSPDAAVDDGGPDGTGDGRGPSS